MNQSKREKCDELYLRALAAEEKGDFKAALKLLLQGSALGDEGAQNAIGIIYDAGSGVPQDKKLAIKWFKKAWRTGKQTSCCCNIALTYAQIGERQRAVYWWNKAIVLDDGSAALALAKFLLKENKQKASNRIVGLLKRAAESGESWQISPAEREQSEQLLKDLLLKDSSYQ